MSDVLASDVNSGAPNRPLRIDAFYDSTLTPKLAALDDHRRQVRWLIVKALIAVLPPIVFLIGGDLFDIVLPFQSSVPTVVVAWLWLAAAIVFALVRYFLPGITAYANYRHRFKQEIVGAIFKMLVPSAVYEPLQGISEEVFDAPGLFNTRGGFSSDDRVRGRIGATPFEASDVGRSYRTGTGKHSTTHVVFRGLFFHLDFNQPLSGVVLIEPARAQSSQIGAREGLSLVTLDHPAFGREFKVYSSNDSEARTLLTSALIEDLLTLRHQAGKPLFLAFKGRRAYVGVHYGRTLFEPRIAQSTSKEAVREIAAHFALIETIVRELNTNRRVSALVTEAPVTDNSLLQGADIEPNPLSQLAAEKRGSMTTSEIFVMASSAIDDSDKDGDALVPRPEGTRIQFEHRASGISITYGLRLGFWIMLAISLAGVLLASSALRSEDAPAWARPASAWVRTMPPIPWLDQFAADAPTPWLIVGTVVAILFALVWTGYVRRVDVDGDAVRIFRAFRPFPRTYRRPLYGRALRINTALYIGKSEGVQMMNPTASPMLTEPEARWLVSEMKRALGQRMER